MVECRIVVNGTPLAHFLKHLETYAGISLPVEAWSRDGWHCPFCAEAVSPSAAPQGLYDVCHHCRGGYFPRVVEGDTFVTSSDDPKTRAGGA